MKSFSGVTTAAVLVLLLTTLLGDAQAQDWAGKRKCKDNSDCPVCGSCIKGRCEIDDSHNPGMCKKCFSGKVVADDSKDPGVCKKCENKKIVSDDSEDPGPCLVCRFGEVRKNLREYVGQCKECDSYAKVVNQSKGTPCDDLNKCTTQDKCDGNGTCVGEENKHASPHDPKCLVK